MFYKIISRRNYSAIKNNFFVTTPIFYVNAAPHIGHLYSAVISDAIARYEILRNPKSNVQFSTGTDEHGTKIQQAAFQNKIPISEYCKNISEMYKTIFETSNINYTDFIRTTEARHFKSVQHFWNVLKSKNLIYSAEYSGWYCVSDETFLTDQQTKVSLDGHRVSLESGHPCEWTEELNYMFPLSKFQDDIISWIESSKTIQPVKFKKILLDYLRAPLQDLSISRPTSRVHWGIKVPEDNNQTIYVWLDALINYLTCAGYPENRFKNNWPPDVQIIGKDILKFHGIYWPAFLIAVGLDLPKQLFIHSHWTVDGQKMSKSKFNVVDPFNRAQIYSMEGLRYFLLREGVAHSDGNYSDDKIYRILNSELADTLGNLLSRACAKALNPKQVYPKINKDSLNELLKLDITKNLIESILTLPEKCYNNYKSYNFYLVIDQIISVLHTANKFFENCKPWELKKDSSPEIINKLETITALTMDTLRISGILLQPIIPAISKKLLDKLCVPVNNRYWNDTKLMIENDNEGIHIYQNYLNLRNIKYSNEEIHLSTQEDSVLFRRILKKDNHSKIKEKSKTKI